MPERSSANLTSAKAEAAKVEWTSSSRMALLLLNMLPLLHLVGIGIGLSFISGWVISVLFILAGVYLLPPLAVRLMLVARSIRPGSHSLNSRDFLFWWATAQWQVLFCRLPALEELLRLVPSLYSFWLRLWGSKIGRLTYWSPGLCILDRSFLEIGNHVVFGAGVRLNPHVIAEDESGTTVLHLAPVRIGNNCRIGGYSLLTAGSTIGDGETLKALSLLPPFTNWEHGRRVKIAIPH